MKLSPEERETIILYNEAAETASVYTHDPKLIGKLKRLHEKYPDKIYPEKTHQHGSDRYASYIVPKRCVSVREPYSEERRKADSERARQAGIAPPKRSVKSE